MSVNSLQVPRLDRLGDSIFLRPSNAGRASHAQYWCNILRLHHQPDATTGYILRLAGDTNGKLVSDKSAKSKRWKEHFEQLLNHPPVTVPNLPAGPREDDVQLCSVPSLAEVSAAIKGSGTARPQACAV